MPCANAPRFDSRNWRDANIRSSAVELNAIRCQGSVRANSSETRPLCAIPRKSKLPTRSSGATIDFDEFVNRDLYHPISARPLTSRAPDLSFSASDGGPAAVIAEAAEQWDKLESRPFKDAAVSLFLSLESNLCLLDKVLTQRSGAIPGNQLMGRLALFQPSIPPARYHAGMPRALSARAMFWLISWP